MTANFIFISHVSEDDALVKELRIALENLGLPVWVDSRRAAAATSWPRRSIRPLPRHGR